MNIIEDINEQIKQAREGGQPVKDVSDCYHTFDELYRHRHALSVGLAVMVAADWEVWITKHHHPDNDPMFEEMFLLGIELPNGSVQYHLPMKYWEALSEAEFITELHHAPFYDGGDNPEAAVKRLEDFFGVND